jgi:thiol:disulfide interchange protein DsbA
MRQVLITFSLAILIVVHGIQHADASSDTHEEKYHAGGQYQVLSERYGSTGDDGKIHVVEMFFYACPHCYELEPKFSQWLKTLPNDVVFERVPAIVGPTWGEQAKAYYVAEKLGMLDSFHKAFFDSIHKDGQQYYNELSLLIFFREQGVVPDKFLELVRSQEVIDKASEARKRTVKYQLRGVPAVVINGKYVTATYYTRNYDEMFSVMNWLIEKERKEMAKKSAVTALK